MQIPFLCDIYLLNLIYYDIKEISSVYLNANSLGFLFRPKIIENILKYILITGLSHDIRVSKRISDI